MYLYQLTRNSKFRNFGSALCDIIVMYKSNTQLCVLYIQSFGRLICLIFFFISPIYYIFITFRTFFYIFLPQRPSSVQLSTINRPTIYTRIHGFLSQSLGLIRKEAERKKGREVCIIIILGTLAPFYRVKVMYGTCMCV